MTEPLIVLGSANRDYTVVVPRHPRPGETVLGGSVVTGTGGKGANQAAAAARAGATPLFIAAVGDDSTGSDILADLEAAGVDVSRVSRSSAEPTGIALITVAEDGENTIVVAAGANATLEPESTVELVSALVDETSVILAQLEIPLATVVAVATATTARVVLNLSPSQPVPAALLAVADPLVVNETEAGALAGRSIGGPADAATVAGSLLATSRSVVLTLGGDGVIVADTDGIDHLDSESVTVVDTTGAGDAFAGALAAALSRGSSLRDAVADGIHAGALAVQYLGAQPPRTSA